jgi:hypothetical protein
MNRHNSSHHYVHFIHSAQQKSNMSLVKWSMMHRFWEKQMEAELFLAHFLQTSIQLSYWYNSQFRHSPLLWLPPYWSTLLPAFPIRGELLQQTNRIKILSNRFFYEPISSIILTRILTQILKDNKTKNICN